MQKNLGPDANDPAEGTVECRRHVAEGAGPSVDAEAHLTYADLERTIDSMNMGVVLVDADLTVLFVNQAYCTTWKLKPAQVPAGCALRSLMELHRRNGVYGIAEAEWASYVASRETEIRAGDVTPREFGRADGRTMIYSVTALSSGKRLITYYDISEMKRREHEVAEVLEKSKLAETVIDAVRDPVFVKDEQLRFVIVNEAFAQLFGTRPEFMLGKRAEDFLPADQARYFEQSERHVLRTGERYEVEEDFDAAGIGHSRIVRKNRVSTDSGKDYVACFLFDVTELKRREAEAVEARQRLADVLGALPAGIVIYDRDDSFLFANDKFKGALPALGPALVEGSGLRESLVLAQRSGYYRDTGDAALDALYDADPEAWIDGMSLRYHATQAVRERRNPDGRWYQVYDQRLADGTYVGVRVDITELKQRERALQESMRENEVFRSLIDNVPVSIYAKREDLRLMYVNQGWCELTGYSKQEAIGRTDGEIFGPEGEAFMQADFEVMQSGATVEVEETATEADGSIRHQFARKGAMVASDGSLYLIGSTTNITELKEREKELEEAQRRAILADRAKSEFLANMSHEIRTPMNGVLGMAELLAKSDLDPKQKTFTDIIVKSGNALLTIINDILDFSKIDAGQLVLDPSPFNLSEAVEDVATLMSTRAKEKDLELIVRMQADLRHLYVGDVGRIRQIITNLLGNAVKFTDSGHVLINVHGQSAGEATKLCFEVTDTGIGIPESKLKLVFEKFSQVDASSTRRHEGTGLGLAITSRLVELMGGVIGVESTEGIGSTFWVTLTLPNAGRLEARPSALIDVSGARVLIVDDNAVNRTILTEQMTSWGFDSCAACSGAEGLQVLKAANSMGVKVDCVVLDYQMPGMTGAEMARILRRTPGLTDTPIVMLTSVDQTLSGPSHSDLSIDAQLIKPARSSALLEALVATIQKRRTPGLTAAQAAEAQVPARAAGEQTPNVTRLRNGQRPAGEGEIELDILVAEDNEVNQMVFSQILAETDLTFEIVANGRKAVYAFVERRPRMILMDVSMPEMNGLEATGEIRKLERGTGKRVAIIGVTAHALKGDKERCIEAGMDDYLPKPISPRALLEKIERWSWNGEARRGAG